MPHELQWCNLPAQEEFSEEVAITAMLETGLRYTSEERIICSVEHLVIGLYRHVDQGDNLARAVVIVEL